jgi:hypothetical protein
MAKSKIYIIYVCKMYNMYTMNESMVGNKEYILEEELGRHLWSCIQNANHAGNHPAAINHYGRGQYSQPRTMWVILSKTTSENIQDVILPLRIMLCFFCTELWAP